MNNVTKIWLSDIDTKPTLRMSYNHYFRYKNFVEPYIQDGGFTKELLDDLGFIYSKN